MDGIGASRVYWGERSPPIAATLPRWSSVNGLRLAAVGILVAIAGAFGGTRFVSTLLDNVAPSDPVSVGLVAAFLIVVAAVVSSVRRAARDGGGSDHRVRNE